MTDLSPEARALIDTARESEALGPERQARLHAAVRARMGGGGPPSGGLPRPWLVTAALVGTAALVAAWLVGGWEPASVPRAEPSDGAAMSAPPAQRPASEPIAQPTIVGVRDTAAEAVAGSAGRDPSGNDAPSAAPAGGGSRPAQHARHVGLAHHEPGARHEERSSRLARPAAGPEAAAQLGTEPPPEATAAPPVAEPTVEPPADSPSTLVEETRLLREAQAALRARDFPRALRILAEHARRFPDGVLRPEREGARLLARCELGERVPPQTVSRFLIARHGSPLVERVRAACRAPNESVTDDGASEHSSGVTSQEAP